MSAKRIILSPKRLDEFRKQVLVVLADYRDVNMGEARPNPLSHESTRVDIAQRVIDNLKAVAKVP